ncbi:alpha/beta hydrolase [Ophiocordyceps camponoti-floridani]|uniref:Alpha/beta hydrolase n=1 Tax=Ophiocordyceps camponoti-floridani TaxID=2030778 RepID=A0A8H4Q2K7_9HYPO|nr:alpha/beta hydrolase [Ophiocordyceps camponoti-floridani]
MASIDESTFEHGDSSFYSKTWTPHGAIKAKLVFVHGFSEHINRYNDFFPKLAKHGIQVLSWDQRGWGRSASKSWQKGRTGPTAEVIADVAAFVREKLVESDEASRVPVFVMGHSMGGGQVLTLAGDDNYADLVGRVRGWILESPFVGFPPGGEPSSVTVFAGRLMGRLLPKQQMKHAVAAELLTRDLDIVKSVRDDPLCHDTGTLEGLASMLDRAENLSSGRVRLGKHVRSVLLTHGTKDMVCCCDAAVRFVDGQDAVEDKTWKLYDGAYHQLHTDHCKDDFARDVAEWILKRSDEQVEAKL